MASTPVKSKPLTTYLLVGLLWLASIVLGLAAVYYFQAIAVTIYALIGRDYYIGVLTSQVTTIACGFVWIIAVIVTGEYHLKHVGEKRSWIIFGITLGVAALITIVGLLLS